MSIFSDLKEKVTDYIDVRIRLFKLSLIERSAKLFSYFLFALICMFIAFCVLLFIGFGLTEVFVTAGLSKMVSIFIVIGIYLLGLIIVVSLRKRIVHYFASGFIRVLTEEEGETGEDD